MRQRRRLHRPERTRTVADRRVCRTRRTQHSSTAGRSRAPGARGPAAPRRSYLHTLSSHRTYHHRPNARWNDSQPSGYTSTSGRHATALQAEVAEWQTRRSQTPLPARACGFDSHLRHYLTRLIVMVLIHWVPTSSRLHRACIGKVSCQEAVRSNRPPHVKSPSARCKYRSSVMLMAV
jgi:hypothetical protein